MRASTLLGLPVTQGGHAEIHTAYLSLFSEMKKEKKKKKDHQRGARHRFKYVFDLPCLKDTPPKHWTCVNGTIRGGVSFVVNSRDVFGNDIY